jgi:hypothetical protein
MEDRTDSTITREDAREYILDVLQELARMARSSGDQPAEESLTHCWRNIWRTEGA